MCRFLPSLLLLGLLLTACGTRHLPASPAPAPSPAVGFVCPPPAPPEQVARKVPPPHYVNLLLRPENPVAQPGQPVALTAIFQNVAQYPITLDRNVGALEIRPLGGGAPVWQAPLPDWVGVTLLPGAKLTSEVVWPGGEPGFYEAAFTQFHFTVACVNGQGGIGGGGTRIQVQLPEGQAVTAHLEPGKAVTRDGITVRVDQVDLTPEATRFTLWVSGIGAPAQLAASLFADGSTTAAIGLGQGSRDAPGGGAQIFADFVPMPKGTRSLTIQVSDIAVPVQTIPGPWRITLDLP